MTTTPAVSDDWLNDPFLDATTDVSNLSAEQQRKFRAKFGIPEPRKDDFDNLNPQIVRSPRAEYAAMMEDPEIRRELAARDPRFAEEFEKDQVEATVAEFRKRNPGYLKSERNATAVIQALAKRHLAKDWLDNDDAAAELYRAGHWTVAALEAQFKTCLRAGLLDVPRGETKELTRDEQLDVIASIRESHPEVAVIRFLTHAFNGSLPFEFHTPRQFMAAYPTLCSKAALFVWQHSQVGLDRDAFAEFCRAKLAHTPMLTFEMIDRAWNDWNEGRRKSHLFGAVDTLRQNTEPEDLDSLSDEEINRRWNQAIRERQKRR